MRGNHSVISDIPHGIKGSPPLVREPLRQITLPEDWYGITPACAGTTRQRDPGQGLQQDHPRLRGNHYDYIDFDELTQGSPPLAREPPSSLSSLSASTRITPACAGTTKRWQRCVRVSQDHPRLRGNHFCNSLIISICLGSPPLAREPPRSI